ncbi:EscU/YscU/HrcU family type III secretion system export apparatus switch protein [uncultured Selenomonas sp.]|uniref:EscU/YscU/HrcU family type III secretion system export apparatus switch protein n=2 Tax=uncultured Selenomonas sp. TaxID=159275 RepID=UPI0028D46B9C|nr:EscU/YscU/HrcU family type III secretion system export apparatus switch protein [uncultured Selenomonas sp.]
MMGTNMENKDLPLEERDVANQRAVALRYEPERQQAPKVVAKGRGFVAENILAAAQKNAIPVYQNKSLVNMLMALELDREIPPELYRVVAEVLAYVYRIDKRHQKPELPR